MISAATETFCRCTFADREGRVGIMTAAVRTPWPTSFLRNNLYLMAGARGRRRQLCRFDLVFDARAAANGRVILCWACDAPVGRGPFRRRGFVELITEHLHFTASGRHFGEIVTAAYVLVIAFVPLFFPRVPF